MKRYRSCGKRFTDSPQAVIYLLSDSDIENGGFRDLLGSEKVREC